MVFEMIMHLNKGVSRIDVYQVGWFGITLDCMDQYKGAAHLVKQRNALESGVSKAEILKCFYSDVVR